MHVASGYGQQCFVTIWLRSEQLHIFVGELLPGSTLCADAQLRPRVIKAEDFAIGMTFLAHHLGADLTKADAVSRAVAMENQAIAFVAHFVPIALQAVPSDVTADGGAKGKRRHGDAAAACDTQELDTSARRAMQN